MNSFNKLHQLRMENDEHKFFMDSQKERFDSIKNRHEEGTAPRAVSSFNLFQTPKNLAERMASMIPQSANMILEPSAGLGQIYQEIENHSPHSHKILVELSNDCAGELYRMTENKNVELIVSDFLSVESREVDCVVMNPPFHMRADIRHILKAREWLSFGGKLIAICMGGRIREEKLKPLCDTWQPLPQGTFKSEGTNVDAVLLTITK